MTLRNTAAFMRHLRANRAAVAAGNVLACAGLIGFIACSDTGLTEPVPASPVHEVLSPSAAGIKLHASATGMDTLVRTFVYDPATGVKVNFAGRAVITVPAAAVCDPKSSGYGTTTWDNTCVPLRTPVVFTLRGWANPAGDLHAIVTPDVRFVPGKVATFYIAAPVADPTAKPVIQWCTSAMSHCVDEGKTDPTLATSYAPDQGVAYRRIKHFSGYNVGWGKSGGNAGITVGINQE